MRNILRARQTVKGPFIVMVGITEDSSERMMYRSLVRGRTWAIPTSYTVMYNTNIHNNRRVYQVRALYKYVYIYAVVGEFDENY